MEKNKGMAPTQFAVHKNERLKYAAQYSILIQEELDQILKCFRT